MNFKISLLTALAALSIGQVYAQDKIYKRNGDVLEGKVNEVGAKTISYKKSDNLDGPNYVINKGDIERIQYDNGDEDVFMEDRWHPRKPGSDMKSSSKKEKVKYGNNILALAPMQLTDQGVAIGLSYERVLDKKVGFVSFYLPITMTFNDFDGNAYNAYHFMPGVKFYPTGSKGIVKYALGPSIAFAQSREEISEPILNNSGMVVGSRFVNRDRFRMGIMMNHSLNINPNPHLYLGLELGFGFSYVDDSPNSNNGDPFSLVQFGFRGGWRF